MLSPNLTLPNRVALTTSYDSIYLKDAYDLNAELKKIKDPSKHRILNLLNIKYLVSFNKDLGGHFRFIHGSNPANLSVNESALPRAFLVSKVVVIKDHKEVLRKIMSAEFDPVAQIYLEEEPPAGATSLESHQQQDSAQILTYSLNEISMNVFSSKAQWLFLSDMFYPGWKATVDGRPVKIYRADYAFRAIRVGPGMHRVEWKYDPLLFKIGIVISLLTAFGLAVAFLRRKRG